MAIVVIIGGIAAAVVGLTQVYKGIATAMEGCKQYKKEKEAKTAT